MADHNDRNQGPDDLYDEAAPRSIFAATWFRAVLVLIVLGVIGAVAVPYILDAMNAPPGRLSATATSPPPTPASPPPTPAAPSSVTPGPATPATPALGTAPPSSPTTSDEPTEKNEAMSASTTPAPESSKAETPTVAPSAETPATPAPKMARATGTKQWFVQVGAFRDPATAKKVAAKLREDKYKVDESLRRPATATVAKATRAPAKGGDRYDVIITGESPADLTQRLTAKGLTAEASASGTIVKPSLPLRDAVALSKELAVDGSKVQVRRAGKASSSTARSSKPPTDSDRLHRVSVGGFPDRATALATLKELEAKGYKPFLTRR